MWSNVPRVDVRFEKDAVIQRYWSGGNMWVFAFE